MKMTQGRPAIIAVTCILALGVVSGLCFAQDAPEGDPTGANLIYNGGFERLRDGAIDGWSGEGAASCEDAAHTGNRSMKLQPGAKAAALGIAAVPTLKYLVGGWFKSAGNTDCGVCVDFYAPGAGLVSTLRVPVKLAADTWEHVEQLVEVPFGAAGVAVSVYNEGGGEVLADDISAIERYQARLQKAATPPVIDGVLDDPCWVNASVGDEDWMTTTGKVARQQTRVFCCYDDDHLYIAFRLYTSAPRNLKATETRDDFYVWRDDSAEVFIDANHDHATYCELEVNPNNVEYDAWEFDKDWDCIWEHQVGFEKDAWICEMAIHLSSFEFRDASGKPSGRMPLPTPDVWGINFARNDFITHEYSSWPNTGASFHDAPRYGHLLRFEPNRTAAYAAQAEYRLQAMRRKLDVCGHVMAQAGFEQAPADQESRSPANWALQMVARIGKDLADAAAAVKPDNAYDDWLQLRAALDDAEVYLGVVQDMLQPQIARLHWEEKLGRPVGMAVSLSPAPLEEEAVCNQWRLDDDFCLYMGRDDVSGFALQVDASAEVKGICAEVRIKGLWQGPVEVVHVPGIEGHESYHWPRPRVDLTAGRHATFWAPVKTSAAAAPGLYTGVLRVTAADHPPLCQQFQVRVWNIAVPQSGKLRLSVLHPDFTAADITSDLAGFGLPDGSVAVLALPPADGPAYTEEGIAQIAAQAAAAWQKFRHTRPHLSGYILGVVDPAPEAYPALEVLYAAVKQAAGGCPIMQIVSDPQVPVPERLDPWVDIWALSGPMWEQTELGRTGRDQRWLYYPVGAPGANKLADARLQPWLARHLQADGIVWGVPEPREEVVSFPMFEMYCRMIALGHRDCDYFAYLYDDLVRTDLRATAGNRSRLAANAYMASRLYPGPIISPTVYWADYGMMRERRIACGKLIERVQRHLQPFGEGWPY